MAAPVGFSGVSSTSIERPISSSDQDIAALVKALREGRAHVFDYGSKLEVHIGPIKAYRKGWCVNSIGSIGISEAVGKSPVVANDRVTCNDIDFPLDMQRIRQALSYLQG